MIQTAQPGSEPTQMVLTDTRLEAGQIRELKDIESADLTGNAGDNVLDARHFSGHVKLVRRSRERCAVGIARRRYP